MTATQKVRTCLWFDTEAEEAANFYISLIPNSRILDIARYGEAGPGKPGSVLMVRFELAGVQYLALNGGPVFKFTEAISLSVDCADQAEVDRSWPVQPVRLAQGSLWPFLADCSLTAPRIHRRP